MWESFSVGKKIFLCLTIIGLGFGVLMAFVIIEGLRSQARLSAVTSSSFPGAQKSQSALSAFEQQVKSYQDAVTSGNAGALEVAKERAAFALKALDEIASMKKMEKNILDGAGRCQDTLKTYIEAAEPVYKEMAAGKMDQMEKAARLNQQAAELTKLLGDLNQQLSVSLNQQIYSVQSTSRLQLIASGIAFLWLTATSLGLIYLIRAIIQPLVSITEAAHRISSGDVNQQVDYHSGDEIGKLAEAFRSMLAYVKGVAEAADSLTRGDLNVIVAAKSERDLLSKNFLRMAETLRQMVQETSQLTQAARAGTLQIRGEARRFQGAFSGIIQGFNETLDAFVTPINEASQVLGRLSQKDMTVRMKGDYRGDFAQIKTKLNHAVFILEESLQQVLITSDQVSAAASQISSGSDNLAQGASEQASSLEEVSASLQETASMAQQNAMNAKHACVMAEEARQVATLGMENMQRLSDSIQKIKASSDKTAKIVKTIDEIAFQTNLLALNAAVEAARAGDAGKGFAVVAEEVRNLAMRSAQAAKNTAELIEESVKNSDQGVNMNQEVYGNLEKINQQVNKVNEVMTEIAASSEQQKMGVSQITQAVGQMNQITQQVAANAEESASSAKELSNQANQMQTMVGTFQMKDFRAGSLEEKDSGELKVERLPWPAKGFLLASKRREGKNGPEWSGPVRTSATSILSEF